MEGTMTTVYIVNCCVNWEGAYLHSVHATLEGAVAEQNKIEAESGHRYCDKHTVETEEVKP
jgi:hypothetical protein